MLLVASLVACAATRPSTVEIAALPHPPAEETQAYTVRLHHEPVVGARSHVIIDTHERRTMSATAGLPGTNDTKTTVHFDAVATILAVEAHQEKSTHYDVASLVQDGKLVFRGELELVRGPTDADVVLTTDGQPLEIDAHAAVEEVLTFHVGYDDDALFGMSQPQRVGARWPINAPRAEQELVASGVASSSVSGTTTLVGVTRVGTVDCLDVHVTLHVSNIDLNRPDIIVEDSTIEGEQWGMYPVDGSRDPIEDHSLIDVKYALRASPGQKTIIETTRRRDGRYTPL